MESPAFVYDYLIMDLGQTLATVQLPSMGSPSWRVLASKQSQRIEERDHMVIYITRMGSSLPYKFVEENENLLKYTRRNQSDLFIRKTPKSSVVTFHDQISFV